MNKDSLLLNLDDIHVKRRLLSEIGRLKGLWEVTLKQRTKTRSLNQNAYYWAAVVTPFQEWLKEAYGDPQIDKEQAHEMLKVKILGLDTREIDGLKLQIIPRSKTLNMKEFALYVDKCAAWLAEFCSIIVIPSELFWEQGQTEENKEESDYVQF